MNIHCILIGSDTLNTKKIKTVTLFFTGNFFYFFDSITYSITCEKFEMPVLEYSITEVEPLTICLFSSLVVTVCHVLVSGIKRRYVRKSIY